MLGAPFHLILCQMPVKAVYFVQGADIQDFQDEGHWEEMSAHVQQHTSPVKPRCINNL